MATTEERLQILDMIRSGQITADEGARLLEALKEEDRLPEEPRLGSRAKECPGAWSTWASTWGRASPAMRSR
jgi:hypothetical protein